MGLQHPFTLTVSAIPFPASDSKHPNDGVPGAMVVTLEKLIKLSVMLYEHLIGSAAGSEARNGRNIISNVTQELDLRGIVRDTRHCVHGRIRSTVQLPSRSSRSSPKSRPRSSHVPVRPVRNVRSCHLHIILPLVFAYAFQVRL